MHTPKHAAALRAYIMASKATDAAINRFATIKSARGEFILQPDELRRLLFDTYTIAFSEGYDARDRRTQRRSR